MDLAGFRNTPSLMYPSFSPDFYFDSGGNPLDGFFRDGRAATAGRAGDSAVRNPIRDGQCNAAAVIACLKERPYVGEFEALYGSTVLTDPTTALERMGAAIAAFESQDGRFHPFTSKYDYWLKGQSPLSAQELRGLAAFNDPCAVPSGTRCLNDTLKEHDDNAQVRNSAGRPHPGCFSAGRSNGRR